MDVASQDPSGEKDPELRAMSGIAEALEGLDPAVVRRVLRWAVDRFLRVALKGETAGSGDMTILPTRSFTDLPEVFDAANPQTGLDKVLVTAYWHQVAQGQQDWDSQAVNRDLKHLGHPSTNITRDLDNLIKRTPRMVLQVRKSGTTKQARKVYKLTREGIRAVENMLNASAAPAQEG